MSVQETIQRKLSSALSSQVLEVDNESHEHAGHAYGGEETHFKVLMVSKEFEGVRKVARHQKIYQLLAEELEGPVHALVLLIYTPEEWAQKQ